MDIDHLVISHQDCQYRRNSQVVNKLACPYEKTVLAKKLEFYNQYFNENGEVMANFNGYGDEFFV